MSQTQACKEAVDAARNACLPQLRSFITESNKNRMYSFVHTCSGVNYDGNYTYNLNCNEQKEYGCTEGYYHSGGAQYSDNYTCSLCPTPGTSYAFDEKDTGGITTCYIPAGRTLSDETGSYKFTEDCYYSN